jgi:DNA-binding PadR family transcriptional regulator
MHDPDEAVTAREVQTDVSLRYVPELYFSSVLELAILGLLKERPMHGYDLRKRMRNGFGMASGLSFGSLYPALARLERAGAVVEVPFGSDREAARPASAEVIPLTGSLSGERAVFRARIAARAAMAAAAARTSAREATGTRGRKVYEITPKGEEMFAALLTEDARRPDDDKSDKSFVLRWSFARHLSPDGRLRLLQQQRRRLEDRLATTERSRAQARGGLDAHELQIADHTIDCLTRDLQWIDRLIELEQADHTAELTETGAS